MTNPQQSTPDDGRLPTKRKASAWFFPVVKQAVFNSQPEAMVALAFSDMTTVHSLKPLDECEQDDFGNLILDHVTVGQPAMNACAVVQRLEGGRFGVGMALMGMRSASKDVALSLGRAWVAVNAPDGPEVVLGGYQ